MKTDRPPLSLGRVAPSVGDLESAVVAAIDGLPDAFRPAAEGVAYRILDWPEEQLLQDLGIDDAYELTGLYDGTPLTEKSVLDVAQQPDVIWLFRRPILDEWAARGDVGLDELVTHVLIHELAHHFGWSDDDIAAIDRWWT